MLFYLTKKDTIYFIIHILFDINIKLYFCRLVTEIIVVNTNIFFIIDSSKVHALPLGIAGGT